MKKFNLLILVLFVLVANQAFAQTTEHFTNDGDGTATFSDNGLDYNLNGSYLRVENYANYGWTGTGIDDWYVDNIDNIMSGAGVIGSITNSGSDFYVYEFYLFPGDATPYISNSGNVIIRGKLDGSTQYTYTLNSGDINMSGSVNNYFTYINFSAYNTTAIDELEFEITGGLRYLAIDAFRHEAAVSATSPILTTTAASSISTTSATLGGNVTADGGASVTERGVVYSSSDATPTIGEGGVTQDANGSGTGSFSESIGSLSPGNLYYFQAYATNSEGTSYGGVESFTTMDTATVTTQAVTSIAQTSATGNGNITDLGSPNPTAHGVCWNTGGTPTTSDSYTDEGAAAATGAFTSSITSLSPNTMYYVRAYATNTAGTVYGNEESFTTLVTGIDFKQKDELPDKFALHNNYPNPFNPKTVIGYQLPVSSNVEISIYNSIGQKVKTLVSKNQPAGYYSAEWNATGFSSGIYFYEIITDKEFRAVNKLILLK